MSTNETGTAVERAGEIGSVAMDTAIGSLSELTAFNAQDPAMVFMAQIAHRWNLAKVLVKSGMIPQRTPEAAIAVMLKGHELGVSPMVAFANMFFFDGKLGMSADLMSALFVQKAGGKIQVLEWTDEVCRLRLARTGWEASDVSYTVQDATVAGLLSKANWKNRKAMLSARARALGVRLLAPDVFAGVYSTEELQDMTDERPAGPTEAVVTGRTRTETVKSRLSASTEKAKREISAIVEDGNPAPRAEAVQESRPTLVTDSAELPDSTLTAEDGPVLDELEALFRDLERTGGDANQRQRKDLTRLGVEIYGEGTREAADVATIAANENLGKDQIVQFISASNGVLNERERKAAAAPAATAKADPFGEEG